MRMAEGVQLPAMHANGADKPGRQQLVFEGLWMNEPDRDVGASRSDQSRASRETFLARLFYRHAARSSS